MKPAALLLTLSGLILHSRTSIAQQSTEGSAQARSSEDRPTLTERERLRDLPTEHSFATANDARIAAPMRFDAFERSTFGVVTNGALRPVGLAPFVGGGSIHELIVEAGLYNRIALRAFGAFAIFQPTAGTFAAAGGELRVRVAGIDGGPAQLVLTAGAIREFSGYAAVQGRAIVSGSVWRLRLTADVLVEHAFRPRADEVDFVVALGATAKVTSWLNAGIEYIAQDFEAEWDPMEMEGQKHSLGPTLAVRVNPTRLQATASALFGLNSLTPAAIARVGMQYTF